MWEWNEKKWNTWRSWLESAGTRVKQWMEQGPEQGPEASVLGQRNRDIASSAMAVIFYVMFIAFTWQGIYMQSLAFFTGEDTGMPGNSEVIPAEQAGPAVWSVVWVLCAMTLYAFALANPHSEPERAGGQLLHQNLQGVGLPACRHLWTVPWWAQAALLFLFSYYIRLQVVALIGHDTMQVMDFERVFYVSLQDAPVFADVQGVNFYRAFPNWALHVKLLHLLNINFGGDPLTGIMCNVAVSSLSVVLLYLIVYFATNKDVFAVIAALIFGCWPFYLYYMILLTPDFNFVFLCLLSLLIIVVCHRFAKPLWMKTCLYGLSGIVLAIAGFFKSVDKILIIALLIAAVLAAVACGKFDRRRVLSALLVAAVFFAAWIGTGKVVYKEIEGYVGGNVNDNVAPYFMNVGMNYETSGQWSQDVLDEYLGAIKENNYDFKTVNAEMKEKLKDRVEILKHNMKADPETIWDFFGSKIEKGWSNNEGIRFIMQTIDPKNPLHDMGFYDKYYPQIQAYQVVVAFLMALGGAAALLTRERKIVLVCALMVFGFALLLLISEVQPRYKTVVFPFMSVVAAYGVYVVIQSAQLIILGGIKGLADKRNAEGEIAH